MMIVEALEEAQQVDSSVTMSDFTLLKMDLGAAYTLLSILPAHTSKFAVELIGGLIIIFLCGVLWMG